jgi:hypothetical protein
MCYELFGIGYFAIYAVIEEEVCFESGGCKFFGGH